MSKQPSKASSPKTAAVHGPVGELLRAVRVNTLQKSVRDVAKLLGVAPIHVSDIETGKRTPSEELLMRIVKVYRVDESVLRAGFERPEGVVGEVANESATAAKKHPYDRLTPGMRHRSRHPAASHSQGASKGTRFGVGMRSVTRVGDGAGRAISLIVCSAFRLSS